MIRKYRNSFLMIFASTVLLLAYNNCSRYGKSSSSAGASGSAFDFSLNPQLACEVEEIDVFAQGFQKFAQQNCSLCHMSGGQGKGSFADSNASVAFAGFQLVGYDKISQNAVSTSHNPPYTGEHNITTITEVRRQWELYQKDKSLCSDGGGTNTSALTKPESNYITTTKNIPYLSPIPIVRDINNTDTTVITYKSVKLEWGINPNEIFPLTEVLPLPTLANAKISINVSAYQTAAKETAYVFTLPTVTAGTQSIRVKGLSFRLNGQPVRYTSTYDFIDKSIYMNTSEILLAGSLTAVGPLGQNDTLTMLISSIEPVTIDPPPPLPTVQFQLSSYTVQSNELGQNGKWFEITLAGENPTAVVVPVTVGTGNALSTQFANRFRMNRIENRFDWDYKFNSAVNAIVIPANVTTASFKIIFSDDLRKNDPEKTLILNIGTPYGAQKAASNQSLTITIPNYAPTPSTAFNAITRYSQLMAYDRNTGTPMGVLSTNCLPCHNSVDMAGNYDITDYEMLKDKGIIIPGSINANGDYVAIESNWNNHLLFRRMNGDMQMNMGLNKMPFERWLDLTDRDIVQEWIKNGALNN